MERSSIVTRDQVLKLDGDDRLVGFRDRFELPPLAIYADAASLGALPKQTMISIQNAVQEDWAKASLSIQRKNSLVHHSFTVGSKLSKLLGAHGIEVVVTDNAIINIFKVITFL